MDEKRSPEELLAQLKQFDEMHRTVDGVYSPPGTKRRSPGERYSR